MDLPEHHHGMGTFLLAEPEPGVAFSTMDPFSGSPAGWAICFSLTSQKDTFKGRETNNMQFAITSNISTSLSALESRPKDPGACSAST